MNGGPAAGVSPICVYRGTVALSSAAVTRMSWMVAAPKMSATPRAALQTISTAGAPEQLPNASQGCSVSRRHPHRSEGSVPGCLVAPTTCSRTPALSWRVGRGERQSVVRSAPVPGDAPSLCDRDPRRVRTQSAGARATARNDGYGWKTSHPHSCRPQGVSRNDAQRRADPLAGVQDVPARSRPAARGPALVHPRGPRGRGIPRPIPPRGTRRRAAAPGRPSPRGALAAVGWQRGGACDGMPVELFFPNPDEGRGPTTALPSNPARAPEARRCASARRRASVVGSRRPATRRGRCPTSA